MTPPRARRVALPVVLTAASVAFVALAGCSSDGDFDVDVAEPFAFDVDFADPSVLERAGSYYLYSTQTATSNVPVIRTEDFADFESLPEDALPVLPAWVRWGDTWAPEVVDDPDGGFSMYFTATDDLSGLQCIGYAHADDPAGPFQAAETPIVCPEETGAIDAEAFVGDDGERVLLWKADGNCCGGTGSILIAELTSDGRDLASVPRTVLEPTLPWEGRLVEAPTLVHRDGGYVLLYSANDYHSLDYAIGAAFADDLNGDFEKADGPILSTDGSDFAYYGPGGQDVVGDRLVFHSWDAEMSKRGLNVVGLDWSGKMPAVVLPRLPD